MRHPFSMLICKNIWLALSRTRNPGEQGRDGDQSGFGPLDHRSQMADLLSAIAEQLTATAEQQTL